LFKKKSLCVFALLLLLLIFFHTQLSNEFYSIVLCKILQSTQSVLFQLNVRVMFASNKRKINQLIIFVLLFK